MKDRRIPVCEPVLNGNEERYVIDCLRTNWISSSGMYISQFENHFAEFCGARHGVACSSGTAAIHLALLAAGIGPGDEVIIPAFTLIASASMVIACGARPVLVDVERDTWCISPADVEKKVTPRTKALMAVHMYGHPCDMPALKEIARNHGLVLVEDAAEAHGALCYDKPVGGWSDVAAFSFYGNKILTTGEGGMVVTSVDAIAERARLLRHQAFEEPRFVHNCLGYNYRMTNLQAAIGLAQCEQVEEKIAKKRAIARTYSELLSSTANLCLPVERPWARNVYWMYGVLLRDADLTARDILRARLSEVGVETRTFFCPMNQQPVFIMGKNELFPDVAGDYPVSDALWQSGLYLPSGESLTEEDIQYVASKLGALLSG